jgi:hypothetical protein
MGWSEEVHQQRVSTALATARFQHQAKRKGVRVVQGPIAGAGSFVVASAAAAVFLLWRRYEAKLKKMKWSELPVVSQFRSLVVPEQPAAATVIKPRPAPRPAAAPAAVSASGKAKPAGKVSLTCNLMCSIAWNPDMDSLMPALACAPVACNYGEPRSSSRCSSCS